MRYGRLVGAPGCCQSLSVTRALTLAWSWRALISGARARQTEIRDQALMNGFSGSNHKYVLSLGKLSTTECLLLLLWVTASLCSTFSFSKFSLSFPSEVSASNSCNGTTNKRFYASDISSDWIGDFKMPSNGITQLTGQSEKHFTELAIDNINQKWNFSPIFKHSSWTSWIISLWVFIKLSWTGEKTLQNCLMTWVFNLIMNMQILIEH